MSKRILLLQAWTHTQFREAAFPSTKEEALAHMKDVKGFYKTELTSVSPGELLFQVSSDSDYDGGGHNTHISVAKWSELGKLTAGQRKHLREGCTVIQHNWFARYGTDYCCRVEIKPLGTASSLQQAWQEKHPLKLAA